MVTSYQGKCAKSLLQQKKGKNASMVKVPKSTQNDLNLGNLERGLFWKYCIRTVNGAKERSAKAGLPCNIDAYDLDRMLVDQQFKCKLSGMPLSAPIGKPKPFGPSLDRIVPELGYVTGNLRIVCTMVNMAINAWGEGAFWQLLDHIKEEAGDDEPEAKDGA